MRRRDTADVAASLAAVAADAVAVFGGFMLATWVRFDSGWVAVVRGRPDDLYALYARGVAVATLVFLVVFRALRLYRRPQTGTFSSRIPRLVRGIILGMVLSAALAFVLRTEPPFARAFLAISLVTVSLLVLLERFLLFRLEIRLARRGPPGNRVLILGADAVAARLKSALENEPRLRTRVVGFLRTDESAPPDPRIEAPLLRGTLADLPAFLERDPVDQVIVTDDRVPHETLIDLIIACERHLVAFNLVPGLFHVLTSNVEMQNVDGVPLLGMRRWPLDKFWNRFLKRAEDIAGASVGLILTGPVMLGAMLAIRRESAGPVLYRQPRCGEKGRVFTLYKLRTMRADAEDGSAPGWTVVNDPRRTRVGVFLRRHNIDELPQLWNVLRGDMTLVGPRPERPHFVQQFREGVSRYMWRHVAKPGITGWAQVNGLRGDTSIAERITYDLYYLENWSLAFDFKILARTLFARQNAY